MNNQMLTEVNDAQFKNLILLAFVKETSGEIDDHKDLYLLI